VPALQIVAGPAAGTHLYQRPGHPPEVRVTDQLLDRAPDHVISGVLGHELAHLINGDGNRRRRYGLSLAAASGLLLAATLRFPAAAGWLSPLTIALGLGLLTLSRRLVLQADATSLRMVDVEQAVAALVWLQQNGLSGCTWWRARLDTCTRGLLSTHPTPDQRLRALRRAAGAD